MSEYDFSKMTVGDAKRLNDEVENSRKEPAEKNMMWGAIVLIAILIFLASITSMIIKHSEAQTCIKAGGTWSVSTCNMNNKGEQ